MGDFSGRLDGPVEIEQYRSRGWLLSAERSRP